MKVRKATPQEQADYLATCPVYPLYGWVTVDGKRCPVEHPNETDGPRYEVMAPAGFHFPEGCATDCRGSLHSLLCYDLADLRERVTGASLTPCTE